MKATINRDVFKSLAKLNGITQLEIVEILSVRYRIDISYKGFNSLMTNKASWKLMYAMALSEILDTPITELFKLSF